MYAFSHILLWAGIAVWYWGHAVNQLRESWNPINSSYFSYLLLDKGSNTSHLPQHKHWPGFLVLWAFWKGLSWPIDWDQSWEMPISPMYSPGPQCPTVPEEQDFLFWLIRHCGAVGFIIPLRMAVVRQRGSLSTNCWQPFMFGFPNMKS